MIADFGFINELTLIGDFVIGHKNELFISVFSVPNYS